MHFINMFQKIYYYFLSLSKLKLSLIVFLTNSLLIFIIQYLKFNIPKRDSNHHKPLQKNKPIVAFVKRHYRSKKHHYRAVWAIVAFLENATIDHLKKKKETIAAFKNATIVLSL